MSLYFECDFVPVNVPLLLDLDVMKRDGMKLDIDTMTLTWRGWSIPMKVDYGHLIVELAIPINYTKKQF